MAFRFRVQFQLVPLHQGSYAVVRAPGDGGGRRVPARHGKAVQADPIKPTLKAPGTMRLKLKYGKLL